ncbi:hypothetical protein ANTPLA_LOCUS10496 [Anthophora plagiata]
MPANEVGGYTVSELKDMLRAYGLNTTGSKAELIARLHERGPTGRWMSAVYEEGDSRSECGHGGGRGSSSWTYKCASDDQKR